MNSNTKRLLAADAAHVWHPYASMVNAPPVFPVVSASGVRLKLADGRELIDGMSSWWCAIHGYNHPVLNAAAQAQLAAMSHVMFGGLTHEPAVSLTERLIGLVPAPLETVFFSDSGSVSVEVAMKLALQYWAARGETRRKKFLTIRGGYHGDTFGAMSVCDPVTGMHSLFTGFLAEQFFAERPAVRFGEPWREQDIASLKHCLETRQREIAALILEPIVQGAGGMWFYSADYLRRARALCDEYGVLLICDEIATGFGRTGRLFAAEHAGIAPDILCVGKALTGGYMSLAATLMTRHVAETISQGGAGIFMHGPTFMANPLACAVALASIDLLLAGPWQSRVAAIEKQLREELAPCAKLDNVANVRVLGAIGVVELKQPVDMRVAPKLFVDRGVWVRPFGRLVYLMPPYVIEPEDLRTLTGAVFEVIQNSNIHPQRT
ncbi:MAG: adenosylmethionine--8-amino-7-oxononanoate transaminase [Gammaproteobacteria bacterium]|nr:MAG: adenosylmethionine--8-amino-7-oxononanoate transaminase [Gammaproteobacteria bacterium]